MSDDNVPSTLVLSRVVKPGRDDALRQWMHEMVAAGSVADGFVGSVQLGQTGALQHLLIRFRSRAQLEHFRLNRAFSDAKARGEKLATGLDQAAEGWHVDVELPSDASAAPWKRFVVTWLSVLPVLLIVSTASRTLLPFLPSALQVVASSLVLTSLLQWVVLPRVQRATRAWTLRNAAGRLRT